jgi:hypothetical protein
MAPWSSITHVGEGFNRKYEESKHGSRDYCIPLQLQILFGRVSVKGNGWISIRIGGG